MVGPGKTGVTKKRRAARKDLLVRGLDMSMRANHCAHASVQHSCQSDFFRSCLRMEIEENVMQPRAKSLEF